MGILVVGGTGTLGRQIVKRALDEGYTIKCLVRDFRRSIFLRDWGSYLVYGDLSKPSSIPLAFKGVHIVVDSATSRLFSNYNYAKVDGFGRLAIFELSKFVQIKKYIIFMLLVSGLEADYPFTLLLQVSNTLKTRILSKLFDIYQKKTAYIIFHFYAFFQGLIKEFAIPILENQTIWVPRLDSCLNWGILYIDSRDAAYAAIRCFQRSIHDNKSIILGTELSRFTTVEILALCEFLAGKRAKTLFVPDWVLKIFEKLLLFFQPTQQLGDRLHTSRLLMKHNRLLTDLNAEVSKEIDSPLKLKLYLADYFIQMLKKLREIYYQDLKSDTISFL